MLRSKPWSTGLKRETGHRPITICEHCSERWPCTEERERSERLRHRIKVIEALLAARRRRGTAK